MPHAQARANTIARICGLVAGFGCLLTALVHQALGGPETHEALVAAQGQVPPLYLAQIEAVWLGVTWALVLFGVALILAALRRRGWLYTIGFAAALWMGGLAAAFVWAAPRWGGQMLEPQALLLGGLAVIAAISAHFAGPRTVGRG